VAFTADKGEMVKEAALTSYTSHDTSFAPHAQ